MTRRDLLQGLAGAAVVPYIAAAADGTAHKIKRGVSLYSYQEEFYTRAMTLEDCLSEASSIGAYGIEMLPEEMVPGFPEISNVWLDKWFAMMSKYGTKPVTYTQFQDTFLLRDRDFTTEEGVEWMERDLKRAKKMGFKNLRLLIGTPIAVIEKSIPLAEKYDLRMNVEIHAPCPIDGPLVNRWVEIIEKTKTTHFGLNPDMGLFGMRESAIDRDHRIREGTLRAEVAVVVDGAFERKLPQERAAIELKKLGASESEMGYLNAVYTPGGQDIQKLKPLLPYSHHIHAKFYDMTSDYQESSVPYDQIVKVLIDGNYEGYLASEYEGQRITQDATETDSCEQVRRQHVMLKRLLGEA